jgi:hypothetical protein
MAQVTRRIKQPGQLIGVPTTVQSLTLQVRGPWITLHVCTLQSQQEGGSAPGTH